MGKANLSDMTQKWVNVKEEKQQDAMTAGKVKLTIYVSQEIAKALWHARAETRKPISHIIEEAVSSFLTPKK